MKKILLIVLCFLAISAFANDKPNVLLIIVDDLNDWEGTYGGHSQALTPNIDALAASATKFSNAQTNSPLCAPSRSSFVTGIYPFHSHDLGFSSYHTVPILNHSKTVMQLFLENDYETYGIGKIYHNYNKTSFYSDWTEFNNLPGDLQGPFPYDGENFLPHAEVPLPYANIGPVNGSYGRLSSGAGPAGWVYGHGVPFRYVSAEDRDLMPGELRAQWVAQKFNDFERKREQSPFFMTVGLTAPHTPLIAPDEFFDLYPLEDLEIEPYIEDDTTDTHFRDNFSDGNYGLLHYREILKSYNGDRTAALKAFTQAYLACVSYTDAQVGKILKALNESKFKDNTIVMFVSDHGWQNGDKNYIFKNSCWESSARIPFIVKMPGQSTPKLISNPISLIDIFPTLVDYCGLSGETQKTSEGGEIGGHSIRPFLEDKADDWTGPDGAVTMIGNFGSASNSIAQQNYAYRTEKWRYIIYSRGEEELYCHDVTSDLNDPDELTNLAYVSEYQIIKQELREKLNAVVGVRVGEDPLLLLKDFEEEKEGSDANGSPVYVRSAAGVIAKERNRNLFAEITPEATTGSRIGLGFNCKEGELYTFAVDVKVPEGSNEAYIRKIYSGANEISQDFAVNDKWKTLTFSFTGKDGFHVLYTYIKDDASVFHIDNMRMYKGEYIPADLDDSRAINSTLNLYPNPNIGVFSVKNDVPIGSYDIYDSTGRNVMSTALANADFLTVDMEDYPAGMYFLKSKDVDGKVLVNEFVIK